MSPSVGIVQDSQGKTISSNKFHKLQLSVI